MTLTNGRSYLAIPGPSVIPDRVLRAMHRAAPNIYTGELVDMVPGIVEDLKEIAGTRHHCAIYVANGHGAWEAAASNVLNAGDRVLLLATGTFAHGWGEMVQRLGVKLEVLDFGIHDPIDPKAVTRALNADKDHRIKAVMATHVDTATSIKNDIPALRLAINEANHPALLMVDCIASLACDRFEMDKWGVDLMVAACQKGLMTPPGMAFVFFNDKADRVRENCTGTSWYWDWRSRVEPEIFYQYFGGTAPTHHLYGLREALDMISEERLEQVWKRHEALASAYWAAFEVWGQLGPLKLNVKDPRWRSNAVTAASIGVQNGTRLREWMVGNTGVTLGIGLGMSSPEDPDADGFFRIGHMGHVNTHMVLGVIGAIETGLCALDIPHGKGALDAAVAAIAAG